MLSGDYMIKINCVAVTSVGKVRDNNEDNFYINEYFKKSTSTLYEQYEDNNRRKQYLYAVCDGMGGEELGEVASMIAVKTLVQYQKTDIKSTIMDYIQEANKLICNEIKKNAGVRIGTTLALLFITAGKAIAYNIGDSRVYLFRNNKLMQLSEDHTQVQRLVDMGLLEKDAAANHKDRHKLTQHLGIFPDELILEPHVSQEIDLEQNDIFLLCSDGLTDMVSDDDIADILSDKKEGPESMTEMLISKALENGGKDNVTVVLLKVDMQQVLGKIIKLITRPLNNTARRCL